jgi:hypothetical protein
VSAAGDVAWQRQLRDQHMAEGVPPVPHLDVKRAVVRPVSRRIAEQIILKYEWLGTMAQSGYHLASSTGPTAPASAASPPVAAPAASTRPSEFGLKASELGTLARGACVHWAPPGSNSKLLARTAA